MEAATNVQSLFSLSALKITAGFFKHYMWFLAFQSFWTTWIARSKSSAHRYFLAPTDFMLQPKKYRLEARCCLFHGIHWSAYTASPRPYFSWAGSVPASAAHKPSLFLFSSFHKGEVSEGLSKQSIWAHMLRSTKSHHQENYGPSTASCCLLTIILFKFMTFTLFHNVHTI